MLMKRHFGQYIDLMLAVLRAFTATACEQGGLYILYTVSYLKREADQRRTNLHNFSLDSLILYIFMAIGTMPTFGTTAFTTLSMKYFCKNRKSSHRINIIRLAFDARSLMK